MLQPTIMLHPRSLRKALMGERRVTAAAIASAVPCSLRLVRRVLADENTFETPKSKRIKQLIAERTGVPVSELWPEQSDAA